MSKKSRKMKWKGVALNHSNIDEYMKDLIEDTAGQYITQGVSFNKEDNFQMTLLKNSILAHGSFSGFVKHLLFAYFEQNGSIDDSVWQPNNVDVEVESEGVVVEQLPPSSTSTNGNVVRQLESHNEELSTTDEKPKEEQQEQQEEQPKPVQTQTKSKKSRGNEMLNDFIIPQED